MLSQISLHVETEEDDIAVFDDIFLTLDADQTFLFGCSHRTIGDQIIVGDDLRFDETALKVRMDLTGSLRGLGTFFDGPGFGLHGTGCQETDQAIQILQPLRIL